MELKDYLVLDVIATVVGARGGIGRWSTSVLQYQSYPHFDSQYVKFHSSEFDRGGDGCSVSIIRIDESAGMECQQSILDTFLNSTK